MVTFFSNFLTIGTIVSGILAITSKNPVISVIFLISTFVQAAIYLILLGINFIGISYIVIYVGAIAVLFLFVIMMINIKLVDIIESGNQYTKNIPLAIVIGISFLSLIIINNNLKSQFTLFFYAEQLASLIKKYFLLFNNTGIANNFIYENTLNETINFFNKYQTIINYDVLFLNKTQIATLGSQLYLDQSILLIILSFILLLSMFAIIIISSKK